MSGNIKLLGDNSGYSIITSNSSANNTTFYLPQNSGTIVTSNATVTLITANLSFSSTSSILANSSIGTAGQVLASNATSVYWASAPANGPAFSAALITVNQTVTSATWTKVTLNYEDFDTNNNFDSTTNYRFTPTVAGYYQISWGLYGGGTTNTTLVCGAIYKNGTVYKQGSYVSFSSYVGALSTGSALVYLNGSTDYVELYGYVAGSGVMQINAQSSLTYLTGCLVRGA